MDTMPMRWAENRDYSGSLDHCACCGRKLKGSAMWIEVIDGGATVAAPGLSPDINDSGYMGFYPVGSTCAKKHFTGFARSDF